MPWKRVQYGTMDFKYSIGVKFLGLAELSERVINGKPASNPDFRKNLEQSIDRICELALGSGNFMLLYGNNVLADIFYVFEDRDKALDFCVGASNVNFVLHCSYDNRPIED